MPGSISRSLILLLILSPLFFIGTPENHSRQRSSKKSTSRKPVKASKRTQMAKAWEQEFQRTRDPELGRIPRHRIIKAYEYAEEKRLLLQRARAIPGVEWEERGPDNYGGRSRTILVDPNDPSNKSVFAASVSGGLWKTTDITAEQPVWNSVNDFFSNIAISTLAYNPANTMEMYFGSGEGLGGPENIVEGNGIWKSTDGGATFTQLASTVTDDRITCAGAGFCDFQFVNKIVVTAGGIVLAATNGAVYDDSGGIMRSTDGGTNWTRVLDGFNGNNVCTGVDYRDWAADLEIAANGDIYAAFGVSSNNGIWKSTDNGATWNNVYASACDEYRIELAVAPSDANYVYAMVARNDDALNKVMRTTNGGGLWTTLTLPIWTDVDCTTNNDITNGQAYYDLAIAVDPADRDEVWIGGIDLHRSSNGGTTWTQLTQWDGQCAMQEVHADQHLIYFQPGSSDIIYFANDGGIYRTENGSATSPTYKRKEFNYNTSQYYSVALHPTAGVEHMIGGTQDNGSTILTKFGKSSAIEVTGGDGAFSHIDQSDPLYQFTAFPEITLARSTNGGNNFDFVDIGYEGGQFINPSDYDDDLNLYYCSYEPDRYIVSDDMTAANPNFYDETIGAFGGGMITAVTVSEIEADVVYFGLDNGGVVRVTDASGEFLAPSGADITPAGVPFNVSVSCIAQDINDADHLVVTYSNYGTTSVYETLDGGNNWDDIEGDLPDMPVRWALFNPNDPDQLLLATEVGVWSTDLIDGVNTEWEPSNTGLANVRTDMLAIRNSDNLVAAATHGRGIFTSDIFAVANAEFTTDRTVVYAEQPVQFDDASYKSTSWSWDFGDGGVSSQQNPQHSFANPGYYTVSLEINGAITETKNNYILVLPNLGTPYTLADGGNFETNPDHFGSDIVRGNINLWERGTPTNQLTTVSSGTNAWKTDLDADITRADYNCALYSPTYNMTAAGTYSLSFQKSMETTSTSEPIGIQVQYTIDRGQNWIRLGSENDPDGTNWFDRGATTSGIETKIIWDRTGFLDNYNNENTAYDISFLAGNTDVAFRIVFYSDADELFNPAGFNVDGFMIDDFQITGPVNEPNINISDPVPGFAIEMDGTDDYVNLEDFSLPNSFSTTFWIDAQSTADGQIFLAKHDAAGNDLFTVGFRNGGIEAGLGVQSVNTGNKVTGLQHIAVTVNDVGGGNSQVTIYKDGNLEVQQTIADVLGTTTGLPWVVGQDWDGIGVGSEFFDGSMDELTFWSKVLTEEEIRTQMNIILEGSESSLVDYWQFNEGAGTSTTGAITSNTGTLISGPTWINSLIPCGPRDEYTIKCIR